MGLTIVGVVVLLAVAAVTTLLFGQLSNDDVAELDAKIATLDSSIAEVRALIEEVDPDSTTSAGLADLRAAIVEFSQGLDPPVTELESRIDDLDAKIATLESSISDLGAVPDETGVDDAAEPAERVAPSLVTALEDRIAELEEQIAELRASFSNAADAARDSEEDATAESEELEADLEAEAALSGSE